MKLHFALFGFAMLILSSSSVLYAQSTFAFHVARNTGLPLTLSNLSPMKGVNDDRLCPSSQNRIDF
jgi:hypothetical protein